MPYIGCRDVDCKDYGCYDKCPFKNGEVKRVDLVMEENDGKFIITGEVRQ